MTVQPPAFLITIDTEGDNLWARPRRPETRNAAFLPRFQALCERHGFVPVYLTNHEMACCPVFREFATDALGRGTAEIGMHLHAWDSPPLLPLTPADDRHHPYLVEFTEPVMRAKIGTLTARLEDTFGVPMLSHRAGRWAFDERYARLLVEAGYRVDCSVTPGVSWAASPGRPDGAGGSDYRHFPDDAYFMDPDSIARPGTSPLLQVPMTIAGAPTARARAHRLLARLPVAGRAASRLLPDRDWLRPSGWNRAAMIALIDRLVEQRRDYAMFMLHSSELMPGGSPRFRSVRSIEALYEDLEALFEHTAHRYQGMSLAAYHDRVAARGAAASARRVGSTPARGGAARAHPPS
jgi:hypothetical protein